MTRPIKFRAWDEQQKMMFPYMIHGNQLYVKFNGEVVSIDREGEEMPEKVTIMQYTGLLDRNGKEIYEGDIVKDVSTSDIIFEVKWDEQKAGYYLPPEFSEEYTYSLNDTDLEVIGNIYENPDLLTS